MSNKNKKLSISFVLLDITTKFSVFLMAAAATIGVMDMQGHQRIRIIVPNQPTFAYETNNIQNNNPIQREREETAPHYISYNVAQRTPSRHGRL